MDLTRDSLPSFLLVFLLKKLFDFLRFTEIWDHRALVIIQPQPDVLADLSTQKKQRDYSEEPQYVYIL